MKNCSNKNCKQQNPQQLENFSIRKSAKDGRRSHCKACRNERNRNKPKTAQDRERQRKSTAKWRKLNPDKVLAAREKAKAAPNHHLKGRQAAAKYRKLHPDRVLEQREKEKKDPTYKERRKLAGIKYKNKDPEGYRKKQNERHAIPENRLKRRESARKSRKKNLAKDCAKSVRRYASKMQRLPKWLTQTQKLEMVKVYEECAELQKFFNPNDPLQVDHDIPMQGENVSGLHVPWNLQILPRSLNVKKGNNILEKGSKLYNQCEEFKKILEELRKKKSHSSN